MKIVIADDDRLFVHCLADKLQALGHTVIKTYNGRDLVEACFHNLPDRVMTDLKMPGNGIEAIKLIRERDKNVFIIAMTSFDETTLLKEARLAGANGNLLKKHINDLDIVLEILENPTDFILEPEKKIISDNKGLSKREEEYFNHIREGLTNSEACKRMFISPATGNTHRKRIKERLNIRGTFTGFFNRAY
jgi:DNA-binding NarL/FixJ family response regulator